jgi:hypothetical protein
MPISKDGNGVISYTDKRDRWDSDVTGVFADIDFAISDDIDPTKQIKFSAANQTANKSITLEAGGNTTDIVLTLPSTSGALGGGGGVNSFTTIQPDLGTSPVATSGADTLTLTSSDNSIQITGDSTTDTIDLVAVGGGSVFTTLTDGLVPGPSAAEQTAKYVLNADGTWNPTVGATTVQSPVGAALLITSQQDVTISPSTLAEVEDLSISAAFGAIRLNCSNGDLELLAASGTGVIITDNMLLLPRLSSFPSGYSGFSNLYVKDSDGNLYYQEFGGSEVQLNGGGGGLSEAEIFARTTYGV